jgi:hypothetical protein
MMSLPLHGSRPTGKADYRTWVAAPEILAAPANGRQVFAPSPPAGWDAAGPKGIPDGVDLAAKFAGEHGYGVLR